MEKPVTIEEASSDMNHLKTISRQLISFIKSYLPDCRFEMASDAGLCVSMGTDLQIPNSIYSGLAKDANRVANTLLDKHNIHVRFISGLGGYLIYRFDDEAEDTNAEIKNNAIINLCLELFLLRKKYQKEKELFTLKQSQYNQNIQALEAKNEELVRENQESHDLSPSYVNKNGHDATEERDKQIVEQFWHRRDNNTEEDEVCEPIIDIDSALEHFNGDQVLLNKVICDFLNVARQKMGNINSAIMTHDSRTLRVVSHFIKGGADDLFMADLSAAAFELEQIGKSGDFDAVSDRYTNMQNAMNRLEVYVNNKLIIQNDEDSRVEDILEPEPLSEKASSAMTVLVVDDSATSRRIAISYLKENGYTKTISSKNGKDALQKLSKNKVDVIISDWNMPVMNGIELLKHVRKKNKYKNLPFIMVTAEGLKKNLREALQAGVSDYICKPFTAKDLSEKVKKVTGN